MWQKFHTPKMQETNFLDSIDSYLVWGENVQTAEFVISTAPESVVQRLFEHVFALQTIVRLLESGSAQL